ncbi:hypothetical protein BC939DRAFT_418760, partial [Gamsiella multidivaricata]|uniref:uncharacterized protein n=1 Tax=Gamsiella multidivaricata TaxID=101098 RepID=UPI00221E55BD
HLRNCTTILACKSVASLSFLSSPFGLLILPSPIIIFTINHTHTHTLCACTTVCTKQATITHAALEQRPQGHPSYSSPRKKART